jgi:phosphomannomutase
MKIKIDSLAKESGVKFGTSGARGLVTKMTDLICYTYTRGFIQYLESINDLKKESEEIAVAGDLRDSTDRIIGAVSKAITDCGYRVRYCGKVPTPTLFFYAVSRKLASVMVTGSHIPADRNGIKYNKVAGEVLKIDEQGIMKQEVEIDENLFDLDGKLKSTPEIAPSYEKEVIELFQKRYTDFFVQNFLQGKKIVVYEHSAVGRDMLEDLLREFGAEVAVVGRSDTFIPLDTEAIDLDKLEMFQRLAKEHKCDALVSTDGDSDRPLVCDENGEFVRGDVLGIVVADYLKADAVVTTASANSALEESKLFKHISRTKIGSPYVVAEMINLTSKYSRVVGYESNGGFLLASKITQNESMLEPLASRDSFLPILSILAKAFTAGKSISDLIKELPARFTYSERIENMPTDKSLEFISNNFKTGDNHLDKNNAERLFGNISGKISRFEMIDGVRIIFENSEVVHIRPSGNAPELRVYTEANSTARAKELCEKSLEIVKREVL